jgi:hypothetical protein
MNLPLTSNRASQTRVQPGRRGYWSGFSVCLFIVLLSVFTWVVHRRVTQYESMQQTGGHHMTATKVCLTERPQISVPSIQSAEGAALFFIAVAFAGALFRSDGSQPSRFRPDQPPPQPRTRLKICLAHFFFLPPPAILSAL